MEIKYDEAKKKLNEAKDYYFLLKKTNFNLKKLISGIIKYKNNNK